jgi:hypothetical protein
MVALAVEQLAALCSLQQPVRIDMPPHSSGVLIRNSCAT